MGVLLGVRVGVVVVEGRGVPVSVRVPVGIGRSLIAPPGAGVLVPPK